MQELDLEGEWDPEAHDKQMAKIYEVDADGINDEEKPHWDDDIDIGDILPPEENKATEAKKKKKKKKKNKDAEQQVTDGGVDIDDMDAEVEPPTEDEWDGTEEMRKRKLDEYLDEIYELEFNDIVRPFPFIRIRTLLIALACYSIGRRQAHPLQVHPRPASEIRPPASGDPHGDRHRPQSVSQRQEVRTLPKGDALGRHAQ